VLAHLDRLHRIREINLPAKVGQAVHQSRLAQLAREGAQMSAQHLRDLENRRRYATLIAVLLDTEATITDQILDMHDRIAGRMFNEAKRASMKKGLPSLERQRDGTPIILRLSMAAGSRPGE
jgi:hypothetical protein